MSNFLKFPYQFYIILTLFLNSILIVKSQTIESKKEFQKYVIVESQVNGVDNTASELDRKGYFTITEFGDSGRVFLLNDSKVYEEYSFGPISNIIFSTTVATAATLKADTLKFNWKYHNSYNDESGNATITLSRVFRSDNTLFNLEMILTNKDVIKYAGYYEANLK